MTIEMSDTEMTHEEHGTLTDYATGEPIRPATRDERRESDEAGPEGVIVVDGRSVYVEA